ncbi:hypothetical protein DSM112329_00310 [Paraconexibacter sp. AEG42_29]|uniref:Lipase n=1 Tax=Paraconexibacter sp. AEG42_29 TaxID=2997339 RepID=A0AAU7AP96_9ACTN
MRSSVVTLLALAVVLAAGLPAAAQAAPLKDVDDPFYRYDKPLGDVAPGTVLRSRAITPALAGVTLPIKATQVLYRTTKTNGAAIASVATILRPLVAPTRQIVSYQTAYDDLGSTCVPSYTIQGGNPGALVPNLEIGFMLTYLAQGFTVVTADYEGLTHDYTAGQGAGYGTLDGIRAARTELGFRDGTPVGMVGYSGGAIATQWASELAGEYAPETNIVGAASGGIPVSFPNTLRYIDGSPEWASVLPYLLNGLFRGTGIDVSRYLSQKGREAMAFVADKCLDTGAFPGLRIRELLAGDRDYRTVRPFVRAINSQIMGTLGTPKSPVFFGNGNGDGIGDGIMISSDVEALAHQYCGKGVPVHYTRYPGLDHGGVIALFEAEAIAFLQARFTGLPAANDCARIPPGTSLKPLPLPPLPAVVLGRVRRTGSGYRIAARLDREVAGLVSVTVLTVKDGKRRRVAVRSLAGGLGPASRTLAVPLRRGVAGRRYEVVVRALADGEPVTATARLQVPRRR